MQNPFEWDIQVGSCRSFCNRKFQAHFLDLCVISLSLSFSLSLSVFCISCAYFWTSTNVALFSPFGEQGIRGTVTFSGTWERKSLNFAHTSGAGITQAPLDGPRPPWTSWKVREAPSRFFRNVAFYCTQTKTQRFVKFSRNLAFLSRRLAQNNKKDIQSQTWLHSFRLRPIPHRNHGYCTFSKVEEKYNMRFQNPFSDPGLFYVVRIRFWFFVFLVVLKTKIIGLGNSCPSASIVLWRSDIEKDEEKCNQKLVKNNCSLPSTISR